MRALFPQSARKLLITLADSWGNLRIRFEWHLLNGNTPRCRHSRDIGSPLASGHDAGRRTLDPRLASPAVVEKRLAGTTNLSKEA